LRAFNLWKSWHPLCGWFGKSVFIKGLKHYYFQQSWWICYVKVVLKARAYARAITWSSARALAGDWGRSPQGFYLKVEKSQWFVYNSFNVIITYFLCFR